MTHQHILDLPSHLRRGSPQFHILPDLGGIFPSESFRPVGSITSTEDHRGSGQCETLLMIRAIVESPQRHSLSIR